MLAPPPEDERARDVGALHGEKRERYLKSLGKITTYLALILV